MDVFDLRERLIRDYSNYTTSFIQVRDPEIRRAVETAFREGVFWPEPLLQMNPAFESGGSVDALVQSGLLHPECRSIFRRGKSDASSGETLVLHRHQAEAIQTARAGHNYILTTGTGSGKSLSYIIPIVDHVLRNGSGRGIQAIVVYPMNALANSQVGELRKFLEAGYAAGGRPVTFERYTGQESDEEKNRIMANPPDILLTNYVMLELILTRPEEQQTLVRHAQGLRFLVLDELHTYRGRQGADVALLVRRVREALNADQLQCVGTSATLADAGTFDEQRRTVAAVAATIFGAPFQPDHIIGETLRRATPERDFAEPAEREALRARVADAKREPPRRYQDFVADPLSSWLESTFGVNTEPGTGRLIRAKPRAITGDSGAARELSTRTGVDAEGCALAIRAGLLGGYTAERHPETGFPAFAFRLHQFISRGDTVFASLDSPDIRYVTVRGQTFVPGDRSRVLLPLAFCRECGEAYFTVSRGADPETGAVLYLPRELSDRAGDDEAQAGFLHFSPDDPWPGGSPEELDRLPEDWVEERKAGRRVKPSHQKKRPQPVTVGLDGREADAGLAMHFIPAPFRFCLHCGVTYGARQSSDFAKLATLGSEGRSTATTILALSAVRSLRQTDSLPERARKLLSFTDNRQDASLQAGHFNDFVEISVLRAGLYRAAREMGEAGISHEHLTQKVYDVLGLTLADFAANPEVRFQSLQETERAMRDVLGYRLYHDLRRGWRITSPNLEQCGLLAIKYVSLDELCAAEDLWQDKHPALAAAPPTVRAEVAQVLLDYMRRELAIKADYLDSQFLDRIRQNSNQWLKAPWALDEDERLETASVLYPRTSDSDDSDGRIYLSGRGSYGQFLRRPSTFPHLGAKLSVDDTDLIIGQLLQALAVGPVAEVKPAGRPDDVPGFQLRASAMLWTAQDGTRPLRDPLRMPRAPEVGGRSNPFFVEFYRTVAGDLHGLEAHEHTAQVPAAIREQRENDFRAATLPVLFCSPTMELGVDISELNVVNLRNVPPTPANYAQRSGRAGRSGQPALVFTYCAGGSPHDQYYFKRPERMVAGAVAPPRLDLANEDLVRAHVHAIWLAETGRGLGVSLKDILSVAGEQPSLELLDEVQADLRDPNARRRAHQRAERVLETILPDLQAAGWYRDDWLERTLQRAAEKLDSACDRWRSLYQAAQQQLDRQNSVTKDSSRAAVDKDQAKRLWREAASQIDLLTETRNLAQSDFYSYRYFASEGFLPGYSFPRLPLSAYIPGRRNQSEREEFLSRPRFLAISEFGPNAIVYHEGSRYVVNRVILGVDARAAAGEDGPNLVTHQAMLCPACGYLHPVTGAAGPDRCERCQTPLAQTLRSLYRLQNVSARRRDRINSDEEERFRLGYTLRTGVRFEPVDGQPGYRTADLALAGRRLATLSFGQAATLWRINLGWKRRANTEQHGFMLDLERGFWAKEKNGDGPEETTSAHPVRVIPYVTDRRNCLLFEPAEPLETAVMASLQAALETAIELHFQLEDNELAAEPLPDAAERRVILFYESAEGGAGVLRRLLEPATLAQVARTALELCHFDPDTGADRGRAERSQENCTAACYDCLLSYGNQSDHRLADRALIRDLLMDLAHATVSASPTAAPRPEHLQGLLNLCGSDLERKWLMWLDQHGYRLPSKAQTLIPDCQTRPDFLYEDTMTAVYVDGPQHQDPGRKARDAEQGDCLDNAGYTVVRFRANEDWTAVAGSWPSVFGQASDRS